MQISRKQIQELVVAWCLALPAIVALLRIHTRFVKLEMHTGGGEQNAALFPRILSWMLLALVLSKTIGELVKIFSGRKFEEEAVVILDPDSRRKVLLTFSVLCLYFVALNYLGYYAATPLALSGFYLILGIQKPLVVGVLSILTTLVIWFTFSVLLHVVLPVGRLGLYW